MKKLLSALAIASLVHVSIVSNPQESWAADLGTISVNCDAGSITGATITATGGVGDTFVIDNTGTTDNCVITTTTLLTGEDANHDSAGAGIITPGGGNSNQITVFRSGTFTISSSGSGTPSATFMIDACSLSGSGTPSDPWLVSTQTDFQIISTVSGTSSCSSTGSYLQTANINLTDPTLDQVGSTFSGVYDGDFWTLNFGGGWINSTTEFFGGAFQTVNGTVKDLFLTGTQSGAIRKMGSLAWQLTSGGLVSRVSSSVSMSSNYVGDAGETPELGGLFSRATDSTIEYSKFSGSITWNGSLTGVARNYNVWSGSLAAVTGTTKIIDSYGTATITSNPSACAGASAFSPGGLVGFTYGQLDLVRTYSSTTFSSSNPCATPQWGGLVSRTNSASFIKAYSTFWSSENSPLVAVYTGQGGTPLPSYTGGLPVAVRVSASTLANITTFQSKEDSTTSGVPSGSSDLTQANETTSTVLEQDYRWAIEPGNVEAFVFPNITTSNNYWTREHIPNTSASASMSGRGTVLEGPVTGYPALGRVWELGAGVNDGFPTLVWEQSTPVYGQASTSPSSQSASPSPSSAPAGTPVLPAATTTPSAKLAKTGSDLGPISLGVTSILVISGLMLLASSKRLRRSKL